jgi:CheY-like chemotaxis protein
VKILIAEDDAISRLILQKSIQKLGHECLSAADGATAWELYQQTTVDVVVSDWMMPGLDGPELCKRVREHLRNANKTSYYGKLEAWQNKWYPTHSGPRSSPCCRLRRRGPRGDGPGLLTGRR